MKTIFKFFPTGCLALLAPGLMMGNVYVYSTPAGAVDPGGTGQAVNASATFTTGVNSITIALSNLLSASQMISAAQLLSDLTFSMNNTLTSGTSVTSSATNLLNVAADGSSSSAGSTTLLGWALTNTGAGTFHLDGIVGDSNDQATRTIIGGTAGQAYTNANNSIAGNNAHNPFAATTGNFTLNIAGVTSSTVITSAIFSFGTVSGNNLTGCLNGTCSPVPEPNSTAFLLGAGMLGFLAYRKKFGTA
jgi:hypothetical protein